MAHGINGKTWGRLTWDEMGVRPWQEDQTEGVTPTSSPTAAENSKHGH